MAANKKQGQSLGLFLVGMTLFCAGFLGGGVGIFAFIAGGLLLALAFFQMFKIKPLEGKTAGTAQSSSMKLVGALVCALGWIVVLFGLHISAGVGGRMASTIVGIAITLVGVCVVLPAACNKNAIWKA